MSFSSKQFLAYQERQLEPDQLQGTKRRRDEPRKVPVLPKQVEVSEHERVRREDEYLKSKGV